MILRLLPLDDTGLVSIALHPAYKFPDLVDLVDGCVRFDTPVELVAADGRDVQVDCADVQAISVEDACL